MPHFADKQNEGFQMISTRIKAQMPITSKRPRLSFGASVVALSALVAVLLLHGSCALAQSAGGATARDNSSEPSELWGMVAASNDGVFVTPSSTAADGVAVPPYGQKSSSFYRPFTRMGYDSHIGIGGIGFDIATPLFRRFNLRSGADFFNYSANFQEQGANIGANLRLRTAHANLDWFPFGGRFRLSPLLVFSNNNRIEATALIPAGSTITLDGQNFISSNTDPLHGAGSIDFRKVSPGITLGFGNIVPRDHSSHISVPIEAGFYYVGQPRLNLNFSGSACDPTVPAAIGCASVDKDSGFMQDLAAFTARNNHNLSYASFFPVFSVGLGYSF
jgi:hypothetical protein